MSKTTVETTTSQKILIIEDEGEMCLVLNILLSNEDIELEHVKNILAAEEYLAEELPSLIILDNKLPDGYGVDYIRSLKEKIPIYQDHNDHRIRCFGKGCSYGKWSRSVFGKTIYQTRISYSDQIIAQFIRSLIAPAG